MKGLRSTLAALTALTAAGNMAADSIGNFRRKSSGIKLSENHKADKNKKRKRKQVQKSRRMNRKK